MKMNRVWSQGGFEFRLLLKARVLELFFFNLDSITGVRIFGFGLRKSFSGKWFQFRGA